MSDLLASQGIFCPSNFDRFDRKASFSSATVSCHYIAQSSIVPPVEVQFTVRVVFPLTSWKVALMVVVPVPLAVAKPPPLMPLLMVATPDELELQCAVLVRSSVLLSEYVPVAMNC